MTRKRSQETRSALHQGESSSEQHQGAGDNYLKCELSVQDRVIDEVFKRQTLEIENPNAVPSDAVHGIENGNSDGSEMSTPVDTNVGRRAGNGYIPTDFNIHLINRIDQVVGNAFEIINNLADCMQLPKTIVDKAYQLYMQVRNVRSLKGRKNGAIATACLYMSCRQENAPRSMKEICAAGKISKREVGRCFRFILTALETSVDTVPTTGFMPHFCSSLGLPVEVQRLATHISRRAVELDIVSGRFPVSVAAAAIFMASQASDEKFKKTPKEIGEIAGIAEGTVRHSYEMMFPYAIQLFPEDFTFITPIELLPQL